MSLQSNLDAKMPMSPDAPAAALPGDAQMAADTAAWLDHEAAPGLIVVVRQRHHGLVEFHLDEIARVNRAQRRVHLRLHGRFDFSGAGALGPKGSLTLLRPLPDVAAAACEGRTWQHGRAAFQRPLSESELVLRRRLQLA